MYRVLGLTAVALLAVPATAQLTTGTISDSNVHFEWTSFPSSATSTSGLNNFRVTGAGGADHLFQSTWAWRIAGDPNEYMFHSDASVQATPTSTYAGNKATHLWPNVDNRNFAAKLEVEAFTTGTSSGIVVQKMTVTNNSAATIRINLFAYADYDQCGFANDSAVANPTTNKLSITDAGACAVGEAYAPTADLFEVGALPGVRAKLVDAAMDDLANVGVPFGPADFTGAWQWQNRGLTSGSSLIVHIVMAQDIAHSGCLGRAGASTAGPVKPGTNGAAAFDTDVRPFIGRVAPLTLDNGLGGSQPVYLLGAVTSNVALPPFGAILVDLGTAIVFYGNPFDALNTSTTRIPIPNNAALCNSSVYFQGFWIDAGAAGSIAHSDRLRWVLGGLF